jgi:hypothetical protein
MAYVDVQYGRFTTGTHPETTPYRGPTMMNDVEGAPQYHVELVEFGRLSRHQLRRTISDVSAIVFHYPDLWILSD